MDDEAMRQMAAMLDGLANEEDTELVRKRMIQQCQRFAFDPKLHPDTRMSASQMWAKLLDMARSKDLGPGKPKTIGEAIERATDFSLACGHVIMAAAMFKAYDRATLLNVVTAFMELLDTTEEKPNVAAEAPQDEQPVPVVAPEPPPAPAESPRSPDNKPQGPDHPW